MRRNLYFAFVLILQIVIITKAENNGFYTIVAPGSIQSNYKYTVSVSLHKNPEPASIKVALTGPSYNETKTLDLQPEQTEVIDFDVPKLQSGTYKLESEGLKGLIFKNSTELNFKEKKPKIYIQTDKAVYKPGDLVQFRILALDENTRPAKFNKETLNLLIKDGANNQIKQLKDLKMTKGVYTDKFQLSEQPVLGNWMLEVTVADVVKGKASDEGTKTEKKFEVAKYVLPKFSVDIETDKDVAVADGVVKVTVRAKYTYGKPVKGKAKVMVKPAYNLEAAEKQIDIDGKAHVEFDILKDLKLKMEDAEDHYRYIYRSDFLPSINLFAAVTEEYTGVELNKTATVKLHRSRYVITVVDHVYNYEPNKEFEVKAYIKLLDGAPVRNAKKPAKLRISSPYYDNATLTFESKPDENGLVIFKVKLPAEPTYFNNNEVRFEDKTIHLPSLNAKTPKKDEEEEKKPKEDDVGPLKLVKKSEKLNLNDDVEIEVKSNEDIPYFIYAIVARGNILKQENVKIPDNKKTHTLKIKPSFEMVPKANLYVYFVRNGDLQFQEIPLEFPKKFQNQIDILAPEQAKPSEEVKLKIKTDPDSFVGLLGVDQSVLLLQAGNDLNDKTILDDLSSYDTSTPWMRGYGRYPGKESGLITQTNANYNYEMGYIYRHYNDYDYDWNNNGIWPLSGFPAIAGMFGMQFPISMGAGFYYNSPVAVGAHSGAVGGRRLMSGAEAAFATSESRLIMGSGPILESTPPKPIVRRHFVENWMFENANNTDANGQLTLSKKIPDTITSWVVTGFSINEKSGFGMVKNPTKIQVFQPFFLSTNLPYSVKRGEVIAIPVVVFNYMENDLTAEVTMENTDQEYDFTEISNSIDYEVSEDAQRTKTVTVPSNSGKSVSFLIRPNKVGEITLKIKAITPVAGDAIHQKLKVEPEGVTQYENNALFITAPATGDVQEETLKAMIPKNAVSDSEYLEFSVVGDILGPTIKNIDKLVRMPYGCGEQNMVNFVPNILVLHYLDAIEKNMPNVMQKAKTYMEVGYQRELTYKHSDGSYSAFGEGRSEGNSWLTAYVARSFIQAQQYISIDSKVIEDALRFLLNNQNADGMFKSTGKLFHPSHQNELGFTAFALLAFLEDEHYASKYSEAVDKAVAYIVKNLDKETDTYALSIAATVLRKLKHPAAEKLQERLDKLAKEENGLKWWTKSEKDHSNDIEITSYIMQSLVDSQPTGKLLPIIKWLIAQRNSMGGFDSSQDTVVGLQALIAFAQKYNVAGDGKMVIKFEAEDKNEKETTKGEFVVDKDNSLILQTHVLPKNTRQVKVEAHGRGSSLIQLSYRYNLASKDEKPAFEVEHEIKKSPNPNSLNLYICSRYAPEGDDASAESNMVVMELYLPSGYTADSDQFEGIRKAKQVQRVETKNSDTAIIVYFDSLLTGDKVCFDVAALRSHAVAKQKPAAITIYDYYDTENRATEYYNIESNLCDLCEGDECGKACKK